MDGTGGQVARRVLPENVRLIVGILTMLCLLGAASGRDRERTLDEAARAQLTQAKQLPIITAARRQAPLDAQLADLVIASAIELAERTYTRASSIGHTVSHRTIVRFHSVSSRGPPG